MAKLGSVASNRQAIFLVVFLVLFIVFCVKYYNLKNKTVSATALPTYIPFTHAQDANNAGVHLGGGDVINKYWVQNAASGAQTLYFPSAADIVAYAKASIDTIDLVNGYTMIVNNHTGYTLTLDLSATGLTTNVGETLANNHYVILQVTLTSIVSGSEAVDLNDIGNGQN
jgi:hypothetical protein